MVYVYPNGFPSNVKVMFSHQTKLMGLCLFRFDPIHMVRFYVKSIQ